MTEGQRRYREYLRSKHWRKTRRRILKRAKRHCEKCKYFCGEVEVLSSTEIDERIADLRDYGYGPCKVCDYWCQFRDEDDNSGRVRLEVHHLTYERIGCERDEDLIALCRYCHEQVSAREAVEKENERLIAMAWGRVAGP